MVRKLTLEIEGREPIDAANFEQIEQALQAISATGPSFFVLGDDTGSYVQLAGARSRLTIEYRQTNRFGFRHYVLGRLGKGDASGASVNYSGGMIQVRSNEILTVGEAIVAMREFFHGASVPDVFVRRETTAMFHNNGLSEP